MLSRAALFVNLCWACCGLEGLACSMASFLSALVVPEMQAVSYCCTTSTTCGKFLLRTRENRSVFNVTLVLPWVWRCQIMQQRRLAFLAMRLVSCHNISFSAWKLLIYSSRKLLFWSQHCMGNEGVRRTEKAACNETAPSGMKMQVTPIPMTISCKINLVWTGLFQKL